MRKLVSGLLALAGAAVLLAGCGRKTERADETCLEFRKNGEVIHTIAEDFSESYYDVEELKTTVLSQIAAFNEQSGTERISLDSTELGEDGKLYMVMTFKSPQDYTSFYRQALFCGTVSGAYTAGYDLDIQLKSVKTEGEVIGREEILDMGEKHILVVREQITVRPFGEILYASEDVEVSGDGKQAVTTDGDNLSFIIFK